MPATAPPPSSVSSISTANVGGGGAASARRPTVATSAIAPRRSGPPRSGGAPHNRRFSNQRAGEAKGKSPDRPASTDEHEILFQKFFKSVGPRTYAAQVKRAKNGNHYLVLMEGKRDAASGDVRKTRLFVYSEDFVEFFRLIKSAAEFIKQNPLPDEVREKRERFWVRQSAGNGHGIGAAGLRK
jgi:hypothetical protein